MKSYFKMWMNYFNFKGRASFSEFWIAEIINGIIISILMDFNPLVGGVYIALTFIPMLSLIVRRLHDSGRSAKVLWWCIIPFGFLAVLGALLTGWNNSDKYYNG